MPITQGGICDQEPSTASWFHCAFDQPLELVRAVTKSPVMPFVASAMTLSQSTAARSSGVRATPARKRARKERMTRR